MKVLLIHDTHQKWGGAEEHFFTIKKKLKEKKIVVKSLGFSNLQKTDDDSIVFPISNNKIIKFYNKIIFNPYIYSKIKKEIDLFKPDIINLFNANNYTKTLFSALKGYKIVQTILDYRLICPVFSCDKNDRLNICEGIECTNKYLIKNYFKKFLTFYHHKQLKKTTSNSVDAFICPSPHLKKCLDKNSFKPVQQIPLLSSKLVKKYNNFSLIDWNVILFVGQLEINKGIWDLVKSIKSISKKNPNILLKIAGNGSLKKDLEEYVKDEKLDQSVKFLGRVDNLQDLYKECSFVVIPSMIQESFGLVTAEAMFNSRAVIGSNRGATPWLIKNNETGLIFDPEENNLSDKIIELFGNKTKLKKYGESGRKRILEITNIDNIVLSTIQVYKELDQNVK